MIDKIIKQLNPLINGKLIYLSQYGSHLYGLNTENSDLDFRGIFLPTLNDLILHKDLDEYNTEIQLHKITNSDGGVYYKTESPSCIVNTCKVETIKVDIKIFSLQKFIKLCSKADTNALDVLFSYTNKDIPKYEYSMYLPCGRERSIIEYLYTCRYNLINTDRLESPCTYAFKQATKYGVKGERRSKLLYVLDRCKFLSDIHNVEDLIPFIKLDDKYLKIDTLDNKGTLEKYLNVCGVQHQFNLSIKQFKRRIQDKIDKEYTSQRTIDACDGNDWKALSHAIRILTQIKELLETGSIQFPNTNKQFLLDIKLGKVAREQIDEYFDKTFSNIFNLMKNNSLDYSFNEEFWNDLIVYMVRYIYTKE